MRINRREFAGRTLGLGAALAAGTRAHAASAQMYVSLNGTLTGGKVPWPEFARLAARVGYGGVDINLAGATKEGVEATRALLAETKLQPAYASLPVTATRDEETFQKGLAGLDAAARFASAIDCNRMVSVMPASSDTPKAELRKTLLDRFRAVSEVLARSGVRLGFEFLGPMQLRTRSAHEFIWRMDEMLQFAKDCGPNMGLLLDAWHWHHAGASTGDIVSAGKARIVTVHVSDCAKMAPEDVRDNQRLMPGEGAIDLVGFFQALRKIGYTDGVSPEPLGRVPKEMPPEEGAKLGLETTLAVMRKAGAA